ncbi:MAG: 4-(cytidine 5'-diphospho)-2-C-methyl-D-erythritol kinase [Tepidisphaeraceae bacterium]
MNLHLRVAAPEPASPPLVGTYHPLRSWMVTVGLFDNLSFEIESTTPERLGVDREQAGSSALRNGPSSTPTGEAGSVASAGISLACDDPALPCDGSNLIVRAALALPGAMSRLAADGRRVGARLTKRIPTGGGLGGGSSNAAATLVAIDRLLDLRTSNDDLLRIAGLLGADVPFFLGSPSSIATGRGEHLEPAPTPTPKCIALMFPSFGVSTAQCFRTLDTMRPIAPTDTLDPFDVVAWSKLPARELLPLLVNDLEPPAFTIAPQLGDLRATCEARLGSIVRMSGSGSTLFTLFDEPAEAEHAIRRLDGIVRATTATLAVGAHDED